MRSPSPRLGALYPSPIASIVQLAVWSASLAGLGEVALRLVARQVVPRPVLLNPESIWMAPLSALLVFAPLIALGWGIGRRWAAQSAWTGALAVAAFLVAFDGLLLVPRVHPLALATLAAGIAQQVVWLARRHPRSFSRFVSSSTLVMTVTSFGGCATSVMKSVGASSSQWGRVTAVNAPEDAPNVLLLVLDTVRAMELAMYGYGRVTAPNLAALAEQGVRFDRAVATAPWTLPTHASLFTGRFQRDLSVGWMSPLDSVTPTLAEHFTASGYATGGFVANLRFTSREYGLGRGFQVYRDYAVNASQIVGSTMLGRRVIGAYNSLTGGYVLPGRKDARDVVDEFLAWQSSQGSRPFFAFLNVFDAHEPYAPEPPYDLKFAPDEPPTRRLLVGARHSPEELRGLRDAYDGAIASIDAQLGRLFEELRRRGVLDRTIVVVTADHGEEFAEHGHVSHGNGLNFPALHVPLVVRWPAGGVPPQVVVTTPVSLVDVAATIVDLSGGHSRGKIPGASLAPLWRGDARLDASPILSEVYRPRNQPDWYPVSEGDMRSLVYGRFHLIARPGGGEDLYDIVSDPFEQRNLIHESVPDDTLEVMRRTLSELKRRDVGFR